MVNLDEPVHEDGAHRPLDLDLVVHVVWVGAQTVLAIVRNVTLP